MDHLFAVHYAWLIPLLPLIGAAVSGFFGARFLKQNSHWPIWIGVGISAMLSLSLLFGMLAQAEKGKRQAKTNLFRRRSTSLPGSRPATRRTRERRAIRKT